MDYNEFATKIKDKYPQYKDMDNRELAQRMVDKYPNTYDVTFEDEQDPTYKLEGGVSKTVDLTPSGIVNQLGDTLGAAAVAPIIALRDKTSVKEAFNRNKGRYLDSRKNDPLAKIQDFTTDMAVYSALPFARAFKGAGTLSKVGNSALTGLYQGGLIGGLESLKNNGNLSGTGTGAGVGATLGAGFPIVGRTIKAVTSPKVVSALTSVPEKYLTRAIEAEKAGNSLFQGQWNPDTAYQGVGRKIREAKKMLPTKEAFAEEFNKQGKRAVQGLENLKNKAGADISEVLEKLGQEEAIDINGLKNALNTNIKSYAKGGDINPALETASRDIEQVQNLLQNETKPIDLHNIKEMLYDKTNYETQGGTIRNDVLKGMANQVNNFLRTKVPEYQKPNDVYSMVKDLERGLGGLNQNTVAGKLANYGNVNNTLSGYDTKIKQLNDLLPREQQFLPRVKEIIADQNEINNIQHLIGDNFVRTPRSLEKVYDLERLQALENLQNKTGVNIMDEFNNVRAREALEQLAPGQGGGSGSAQGFLNNVLRPAISTTATALGTLGGGLGGGLSSGLISTLLYSPKIMGQGYVKVGGSPFLQKLFASQGQEAPQWFVPLLYGGANE